MTAGTSHRCNWVCTQSGACGACCSRRALQRGAAHRLQIFRHKFKGWCLRSLSFIPADAFVMEYASRSRATYDLGEFYL